MSTQQAFKEFIASRMPGPTDAAARAKRIAIMRASLRPSWVSMESGGMLLATETDDDYARTIDDLLQFAPEIPPAANDETRIALLARILAGDVEDFLRRAGLPPGIYVLDNDHLVYSVDGQLPFSANEHEEPIALPMSPSFTFRLTEGHLALLRYMNVDARHGVVELMSPKRPYGEMTYYFIDMAEALGREVARNSQGKAVFSEEEVRMYTDLHREMLFATQAFWRYAEV